MDNGKVFETEYRVRGGEGALHRHTRQYTEDLYADFH